MAASRERIKKGTPANEELMLTVARAYYLKDRSKVEIAQETGLSRWQVARLITDARDLGIVTIEVSDPGEKNLAMGARIAAALGIDSAIVIGRSRGLCLEPSIDTMAEALARHLTRTVKPGDRLGLAWSRVIEAMPGHLTHLAPCDVIQMAGALTFPGDRLGSVEIIRQVARIAKGTAYPIYAPLVAPDRATAQALLAQPEIADVLQRAGDLDLAVVGIGTWTAEGSSLYSLVSPTVANGAACAGAQGVISARVFDAHGVAVAPEIDARVIGLSAAQLRQVPRKIATCCGAYRVDAALAAVRGGFVSTLFVDEALGLEILRRTA